MHAQKKVKKQNVFYRFRMWFSASIQRRLVFVMLLVSLILIVMFWFLGVEMLEPVYRNTMYNDLVKTQDIVVKIIQKEVSTGNSVVSQSIDKRTGEVKYTLNSNISGQINLETIKSNINVQDNVIDIFGPNYESIFMSGVPQNNEIYSKVYEESNNSISSTIQRSQTKVDQICNLTLASGKVNGKSAFFNDMMFTTVDIGNGCVLMVSSNVEQISQSVALLRSIMVIVSAIILGVAIISAILFSQWLTQPISQLSLAARQIAKGNYNISLHAVGNDEIAKLSEDFNVMVREVKQSAELQRELLANVSHDLRTPLTLIKGYAETIRDLTGDEPEKRNEQLNVIIDETDRLSTLVNSVMELSRMSTGNEKPQLVEFNLGDWTEEISARYEMYCEQEGKYFDLQIIDSGNVKADPALLERVFQNLVGNALHHVGEDNYLGVVLKKSDTNPQNLRLEVIDHGPGISPEDIDHVFERYYRSRANKGKQGTGLGLSISKAILDAHGFSYGVNSKLGEGATFWFEIPMVQDKK